MQIDPPPFSVPEGVDLRGLPFSVADLQELRRLTLRPPVVFVSAFSSPGDAGGRPFAWFPGDGSDDDGVNVIRPDNGQPGRFKAMDDGVALFEYAGAKGDGGASDSAAAQIALASSFYVAARPGRTYSVKALSIGTVKTLDGRGALFKAEAGAARMFTLTGYSPYLKEVYVSDNGASSGPAVEINGPRLASVQDLTVINAGAGAILLRDADGNGVALPNINDVHAQEITGHGVEMRSSVSELKATNIHMAGMIDFVGGLGKPRAGSVGWRQNTPLIGGLARGGHQIVNANMIGLGTGWHFTDAELSEIVSGVADGCSGYGLVVDGASKDLTFTHFFLGTSRGAYFGGTSERININGLETKFNGVVPPWGLPDYYDDPGPYYDVTVADSAKVTINGDAWFGNKRVLVAPGATLVVSGGVRFNGRTIANTAVNTDLFLSDLGASDDEAASLWRAPHAGYLFELNAVADVAPGSSQTYTYTARVGGLDTALVATIAGSANLATAYGPIFVAKGQSISIKRRSSGGAAINAREQVSLQLLPL